MLKNEVSSQLQADATADLVYRVCPMHLLGPAEFLKDLQKGQVLEILTGDDGALEDIPAWCAKHGHEFVGICEQEDERRLQVIHQENPLRV